jgi:hypothetical protein
MPAPKQLTHPIGVKDRKDTYFGGGMKKHELWLSIAIIAVLGVLNGCSRNRAPERNQAQGQPKDTGAVLKQQTDDVERRTNAELGDWDRRIDQLKDESKHVKSKAVKSEWKNGIADLTRKRDTVKDRLSDLKSAGADTWQTANNNLDTARAELKKAYDELVTKLGRTVTPPLRPDRQGS